MDQMRITLHYIGLVFFQIDSGVTVSTNMQDTLKGLNHEKNDVMFCSFNFSLFNFRNQFRYK